MVKQEKVSAEDTIRHIRREARRKYNAEEKIRIVLEGLRGEASIAELCRREGINPNLYYKWSKAFLEAGKARLTGDTKRQATSNEVDDLHRENEALKQVVAELLLKNRVLKKGCWQWRACHGRNDTHERQREDGNHPPRGRVWAAGEVGTGRTGHCPYHVLPLV
jgi:transposase